MCCEEDVHPRFTFLSSRIIQKRKRWLAEMLELPYETCIAKSLGPRWWFHFGEALCEVIMPADFYKVGPVYDRRFDDLGLNALARDWAAWPGEPSEGLMNRSQFNLFYDIGLHLFGRNSAQAVQYAMYFIARTEPVRRTIAARDQQRYFLISRGGRRGGEEDLLSVWHRRETP
jgi:hypothetical protein